MTNQSAYLAVSAVATLLDLHPETVRQMVRDGRLPAFKVGRSWRFDLKDIEIWRDQNRINTVEHKLVLIVDDDENVCKLLSRLVRRMGIEVHWFTRGEEGLSFVEERTPDLILLDLAMPNMNGPQFLEKLRETHPALPVVIITGYPDGEMMRKAMQFAPVLLLEKPLEPVLLERTVRSVIGEIGQFAGGNMSWKALETR